MFNFLTIGIICVKLIVVCSYSFDTSDVQVISDDSVKDSYFAYSLLLQKGTPPVVIVGAPKSKDSVRKEGGSVYRCDLDLLHCTKYNIASSGTLYNFNGDFLGASIDGDEYTGGSFFACAPETVKNDRNSGTYYMYGLCFYQRNSTSFTETANRIMPIFNQAISRDAATRQYFYDNGYAQVGFSISYIKEKHELLLGGPGIKGWNGATVSVNLLDSSKSILPSTSKVNSYTYFGYTVTTGKFEQTRSKLWYISGAPRDNYLQGSVTIYEYDIAASNKMKTLAKLQGSESGAYFGSSILAVDVNGDHIDDILVGAPMAAGKTWDEGCVEFFRFVNGNKIEAAVKLFGSSQTGSRFGTSLAYLGDIDLDGYNDVAISAPYENHDTGAVYIYMGSSIGIQNKVSQKLTPSDFNLDLSTGVRGFGYGMSKGNDIDGNGHNDLAIGAYKSSHLFILKTLNIIDISISGTPNTTVINTNTTLISIQYCLLYTQRSTIANFTTLDFKLTFHFDYRTSGGLDFMQTLRIDEATEKCQNHDIQLKPTAKDLSPFLIKLNADVVQKNIIAHGDKTKEYKIPFAHGCGTDNFCTTDLSVKAAIDSEEIVVGLNDELTIHVDVENFGEPAYQCELHLKVPTNVDMKSPKNCNKNNGVYICPFDKELINIKQGDFILYLKNIDPSLEEIEIEIEAKSLGKNNGSFNIDTVNVPVVLKNSPFVTGKSEPDTLDIADINSEDGKKSVTVHHKFSVGNTGPSPIKLVVSFMVPVLKLDDKNVVDILKIQSSLNDVNIECFATNYNPNINILKESEIEKLINVPLNRTMLLTCGSEANQDNCIEYLCNGEYLYKSAVTASYDVKFFVDMENLATVFKKELQSKDLIALISTAYLRNSSDIIYSHTSTLIWGPEHHSKVALWIYIVASIAGLLLLILVIFLLYKCHFFDRNYKDKLNQEKLIDDTNQSKVSEVDSNEDFQLKNVELMQN